MRVPNLTTTDTLLRNLQSLDKQQLKLQQQASDGQKISLANEDPTTMSRVLRLETDKREMVQYRRNAGHALDVANTSFASLQKIEDLVSRAMEITRLTSSGLNPNAFATYAKEVEQIKEEALVRSNSSFNGKFLFGGAADDVPPYDENFQFKGNRTDIAAASTSIYVAEGTVVTPNLKVSTTDEEDFFVSFFTDLNELESALNEASQGYKDEDEVIINTGVTRINAVGKNLLKTEDKLIENIGDMSAIVYRIETAKSHDDEWFLQVENRISTEVDADITETIVKLNQSRTAYQAALQTGVDLFSMTLLQYI
jgi:flagellar hook-associated protein 3 FlgL